MRTLFLILLAILPACVTQTALTPSPAPAASPRALAASRQSRPIDATTLGSGPTRIYLIASIHGDESEGRSALDQLRRHLALETSATYRLVADMNPDGSARRSRTNAAGVDLNRNWPASNFKISKANGKAPLSEPETAAIHADIAAFDPHVIVVLHSARNGPFVNYDGPPAAAALADRFSSAARRAGDPRWRTVADMGYPTPGSMGSYFGDDRGLPILTIEFRRTDPDTKILQPLLAGITSLTGDRALALRPLSRTNPARRLARRPDAPSPAGVEAE
jgi:predicted deacylase